MARTVSDVMTRNVEVANPTDSIQSVAQRMGDLDVGVLPVCDGRRIQGMVTDRDIAIRGVGQGVSADSPISRVMTGDLEYAWAGDDLDKVHDRMTAANVRRLPVVDENKDLVGIVSLGDLARTDHAKDVGATLEDISEAPAQN